MDKKGVAIKGYDPVAYHTLGKPVLGSKEITLNRQEAVWHFSTDKHLELFKADPDNYGPQYGGYCAYAMALGDFVDIDPKAWKIVGGKLFLN